MVCLNTMFLNLVSAGALVSAATLVSAAAQHRKNRQAGGWVDDRQQVEDMHARIREKWKYQALYNTFW